MVTSNALLEVDLTRAQCCEKAVAAGVELEYFGGRGLGGYLVSSISAKVPPLHPAAGIALCTGPLAGTGIPGAARVTLSAKSPLTGTIMDSNSGSALAPLLAMQGLRGIFIVGRCREPSYLLIEGGKAKVTAAWELWGKPTGAAFDWLRKRHPSAVGMAIGPAGERGVLFANVICEDYGAFGRGGLGAVLGSKNLKAVAVCRPGESAAAEKSGVLRWKERMGELPLLKHGLSGHGTTPLLKLISQLGMLYTSTHAEKAGVDREMALPEAVSYGCGGCTVSCKRRSKKGNAPLKYQSLWAMGTQGESFSIETAQEAGALCDELGMDVVSAGSTLGCARMLEGRGMLEEGLEGIGSAGLVEILEKIACREGAWAKLGEGSLRLAAACGNEEMAVVVKGMEVPGFDPRGVPELALSYATSNRGACHSRGVPPLNAIKDSYGSMGASEIAVRVIEGQDWEAAMDSLMLCRFVSEAMEKEDVGLLCTAALGRTVTPEDLLPLGARIWNLERCYNLAAGIEPSADHLPSAVESTSLQGDELRDLLREYYRLRGWSKEGRPEAKVLERLGLEKRRGVCVGEAAQWGEEDVGKEPDE